MKAQSVRIGLLTWDEVPDNVRACFDTGCGVVHENGMIYTRTGGKILCCEDSEAGDENIRTYEAMLDRTLERRRLLDILIDNINKIDFKNGKAG